MHYPDLNRFCRKQGKPMLKLLKKLVEIESPSHSKRAVDRLGRFLAAEFRRRGAKVSFLRSREYGDCLRAEFHGNLSGKPILVLGHLDTVWALGTLKKMPFRIRGGRAYGPGALDMKAGIVCGLFALDALQWLGLEPSSPIVFLLDSDEELSSAHSCRFVRNEAKESRLALVLEPAADLKGSLKTARKGVGAFHLVVEGRGAHAGINPRDGINAVTELARQMIKVESFAHGRKGMTLNVGVVQGGTRSNVVPARAEAWVDVRVERAADGGWIEKKMRSLRPVHRGAKLHVSGGLNRPPMVRTAQIASLFREARAVAQGLGFKIAEASTGGGSDGNITAAMGVGTLDGLGAVGEGAHASHEHVLIRELPRRTALLAGLMARL